MDNESIITPEICRQLLRYDAETGLLYWRDRPWNRAWSARWAGREAFTCVGNHGYREGSILNRHFLAHRVIWAIVNGSWPDGDIDHKDGDTLANKPDDMRDVSTSINLRNARGKSCNTSGITGVSYRKDRGTWRARIMVNYAEKHLGTFTTKEAAEAVYRAAARELGFTERHGSFS